MRTFTICSSAKTRGGIVKISSFMKMYMQYVRGEKYSFLLDVIFRPLVWLRFLRTIEYLCLRMLDSRNPEHTKNYELADYMQFGQD